MWLFKYLKARILKSVITWSEMGKQTTQAKEVYIGCGHTRELTDYFLLIYYN